MRLYPAIDIKDGKCVRLTQGLFDKVKTYDEDPVNKALEWEAAGAEFIHLVDLDGARLGRGINRDVIKKIASTLHVPVQLGGGIRNEEDLEEVLSLGVYRGIIGTKAVSDPVFVERCIKRFGSEHVVIGIDAKNGLVATHGWEAVSDVTAIELGKKMAELGVKTIVYTDISKDGMLAGPNVEATAALSDETSIDIIASGGVSKMEDLDRICEAGIHGAIIGKALYEKRIILSDAVKRFKEQ
ncbi:MAG: 1-(5-phosphoribosyl)-5-[(5-phosphoribosylamino)methylideneamino]imidazole-4-carboxamide isomerase [Lachnospiraceae bacterium]|nr:1-(5-phosphoribosyl)-5-[(5-phosphoribosylamino)methylideneamino]imidazole-4-carboxamide isomerase [Lachnospiraceae bacterium]